MADQENQILSGMQGQSNDSESDLEVTENPDGSASISEKKSGESKESKDFYRNLAEDIPQEILDKIATDLLELIDKDKESRKRRDEQVEEGKKRMGLDKETLGGANFTGASNVTHPMYTKASIDFEARAIKEIFPPGGPVREYMPGNITDVKMDKARRKAKWMNYQLTSLMPNFRPELEQIFINLPMDGNEYQKFIPPFANGDIRGTKHEWIPVDKMLLPFAATNYYSAERRTHWQEITAQEFQRRMRSKTYRDIGNVGSPVEPEGSKTEQTTAKIEGKTSDNSNPDGLRTIYECDCLYEIRDPDVPGSHTETLQEDSGTSDAPEQTTDSPLDEATEVGPFPYLISIDETTKEVLSIYRNWDPDDEMHARLEWTIEWLFIPFRGAYALGLPHIIGGLSIAATGALRALLDSAHINNLAGMVKIKGAAGSGQNIRVSPTEVTEIENSGEIDDIRKLMMPVPFSPPSPVLLTLLGILGDQAEQVIRTTIEEAEAHGDVPVGTTLARIEQGMVAFSAIHGRLHDSMDRLLKILHRINQTWLDDKIVLEELGEQLVTQQDFEGPSDVLPVSDPNIFCEVQRYGQIQTVAQRATLLAQLGQPIYDMRKVEELILKQMKLPNDGRDLLVQKPEPQQLNPVNENVALALGRPIVAFPQQDHEAHISTHCDYWENPFFQLVIGSTIPAITGLMQNLKEHVIFWYAVKVHAICSQEATMAAKNLDPNAGPVDIGSLPQQAAKDPQVSQLYDQMLSKASVQVMQLASQSAVLKRAAQTIQQLQQKLQAMQPPPPMDPTQAAMAQVKQEGQTAQMEDQTRQKEIATKAQTAQAQIAEKAATAAAHEQAETQRSQMSDYTKQLTTTDDNQTALTIAASKSLEGEKTNVSDGTKVGKSSPGK